MAVIVDTSCLITLSKIKRLHLLKQLFNEVVIPETVYQEYNEVVPEYIKILGVPDKNLRELDLSSSIRENRK